MKYCPFIWLLHYIKCYLYVSYKQKKIRALKIFFNRIIRGFMFTPHWRRRINWNSRVIINWISMEATTLLAYILESVIAGCTAKSLVQSSDTLKAGLEHPKSLNLLIFLNARFNYFNTTRKFLLSIEIKSARCTILKCIYAKSETVEW